jgi:hypothetical protein
MKTAKCIKHYEFIREGEELVEFFATPKVRFYAQKGRGTRALFFPANRIEKCGHFKIAEPLSSIITRDEVKKFRDFQVS